MKVYVASSWRNERQPEVVDRLRQAGHEVYDFRQPTKANRGFHWSSIDPNWTAWTPEQFIDGLSHPIAKEGFELDMCALEWCDACVMVQPCGVSSALELGWAVGAGKMGVVLVDRGEPELMLGMAYLLVHQIDDLVAALGPCK